MNDIIFNQEIFIYIYSFYTNTVKVHINYNFNITKRIFTEFYSSLIYYLQTQQ